MLNFANLFFTATAVSFILIKPLIKLANHCGFLDIPNARSSHKKATPLAGGVAIAGGFYTAVLIFAVPAEIFPGRAWLIYLPLAIFSLGLVDDYLHTAIDHKIKLLIEFIVAFLFVANGAFLHITPFIFVDQCISIFWIIGFINAFNLLDNMNGLSAFIAIFTTVFLCFFFIQQNNPATAVCLILAGACLGFLFFNYPTASIFMGDAGSLFIGSFISVLAIILNNTLVQNGESYALGLTLLFLLVPFIDTSLVIFLRLRAGRPIYCADRSHLSHQLVRFGFPPSTAVLILTAVSCFFSLIAILIIDACSKMFIL